MYCFHSIPHYTSMQSCQQDRGFSTASLTRKNAEPLAELRGTSGGVVYLTDNMHAVWSAKVHQKSKTETRTFKVLPKLLVILFMEEWFCFKFNTDRAI